MKDVDPLPPFFFGGLHMTCPLGMTKADFEEWFKETQICVWPCLRCGYKLFDNSWVTCCPVCGTTK